MSKKTTLKIGEGDLTLQEAGELDRIRSSNGDYSEFTERVNARVSLSPERIAAGTIQSFCERDLDINHILGELRRQTDLINSGDMSRPEAILLSQAHVMNSMFAKFVEKAQSNLAAGYYEAAERNMKFALKTQSQTVRTVEVIGGLKNPRVAIVQQANIANGPQQVNNGIISRPQENQIEQTKQSERQHELLQNTGTQGFTGAANPEMEAVGKLYRA